MATARLIAIAGAPGSGKTRWIAQAVESAGEPALYWPMGGAGVPLDAFFLASQCGNLDVMSEVEPARVTAALEQGRSVYVEIDNSVDLMQVQFPVGVSLERIGLQPQGLSCQELETWSDRLLPSPLDLSATPSTQLLQICAVELTGQVFDPPSLDVVWQEIVGGAYGLVQRAKGIFCLVDGPVFYFSFVTGRDSTYTRLGIEPCLLGRPIAPSGIEIVGCELKGEAILANLQDCLLSDLLLQQHQVQMAEAELEDEPEVEPEATPETLFHSPAIAPS